jgi:arginyl-tRNA synthetase
LKVLKYRIAQLVSQAAAKAQSQGLLPDLALPEIIIERPQNSEHGDYASSLPLKLARSAHMDPYTIAQNLAGLIPPSAEIEKVMAARPGYVNFILKGDWLARQVDTILEQGQNCGDIDLGKKTRVQLEFVSVNPTGPLHVGHGRGAVLGSTLAMALSAAGYYVEKEYYVNDAGAQIEHFRSSLFCRYQQGLGLPAEMPAEGYIGSYMVDLAREIIAEHGDRFSKLPLERASAEVGRIGLDKMLAQIKADLELTGVTFDLWFNESSLFQGSQYSRVMSLLKEKGYIADKEGALWFASTALGESKDNVLVRSDGTPTYFASDIAYHYNKFVERNFDQVINIWGADHQGHVSRMKAAVGALGVNPERLKVIITQMVTLRRGEEVLKISKRSGELITLREVVEEVGPDACRFFFLARSADSQMDFDLELAKKQSEDNPVYYVQYAHARIASILRRARGIDYSHGDVSLLTSEPELSLIRYMLRLPEVVETVASNLEPHHLPYYAQELATAFHSFYKQCRVISKDHARTQARLKLVAAAKVVLARTLQLMGITAPEQM